MIQLKSGLVWFSILSLLVIFQEYLASALLGLAIASVIYRKVHATSFYKNRKKLASSVITLCVAMLMIGVGLGIGGFLYSSLSKVANTTLSSLKEQSQSSDAKQTSQNTSSASSQNQKEFKSGYQESSADNDSFNLTEKVQSYFEESVTWLAEATYFSQLSIRNQMKKQFVQAATLLLNWLKNAAKNIPALSIKVVVFFFGLFFGLIEASTMSRAIEKRLKNKKLFQELKNAYLGSCEAVFLGSVLVGLIQAFLLSAITVGFSSDLSCTGLFKTRGH